MHTGKISASLPLLLVFLSTSLLPAPDLSWKEIRLSRVQDGRFDDRNEGVTLADVDRDGKMDVIAGGWWYRAPGWDRHVVRDLEQDKEFARNNGDLALDVDGDDWVDVISGSWFSPEVYWYRNPGKEGLERGEKWKPHLITKMRECEGKLLQDFDGDGLPELVLNSWNDNAPVAICRLTRGPEGPRFQRHDIGKRSGHGMGIGDINGDGRADVVVHEGWFEVPPQPFQDTSWTFHKEFNLGHTSLPCAIHDVNGDGLADIIYGEAHNYGLFWLEQGKGEGGKRTWERHLIDKKISQAHAIVTADLDGDGKKEVITGKRLRGHAGGDKGAKDPVGLYYYNWNPAEKSFTKHTISEYPGFQDGDDLQRRGAPGTGMQICIQDLNGDGRPDLAVAGKSGTYILLNQPDA